MLTLYFVVCVFAVQSHATLTAYRSVRVKHNPTCDENVVYCSSETKELHCNRTIHKIQIGNYG